MTSGVATYGGVVLFPTGYNINRFTGNILINAQKRHIFSIILLL